MFDLTTNLYNTPKKTIQQIRDRTAILIVYETE